MLKGLEAEGHRTTEFWELASRLRYEGHARYRRWRYFGAFSEDYRYRLATGNKGAQYAPFVSHLTEPRGENSVCVSRGQPSLAEYHFTDVKSRVLDFTFQNQRDLRIDDILYT